MRDKLQSVGPFIVAIGKGWWAMIGSFLGAFAVIQMAKPEWTVAGWLAAAAALGCFVMASYVAFHDQRMKCLELQSPDQIETMCSLLDSIEQEGALQLLPHAAHILEQLHGGGAFRKNPSLMLSIDRILKKPQRSSAPYHYVSNPKHEAFWCAVTEAEIKTGLKRRPSFRRHDVNTGRTESNEVQVTVDAARILAAYVRNLVFGTPVKEIERMPQTIVAAPSSSSPSASPPSELSQPQPSNHPQSSEPKP